MGMCAPTSPPTLERGPLERALHPLCKWQAERRRRRRRAKGGEIGFICERVLLSHPLLCNPFSFPLPTCDSFPCRDPLLQLEGGGGWGGGSLSDEGEEMSKGQAGGGGGRTAATTETEVSPFLFPILLARRGGGGGKAGRLKAPDRGTIFQAEKYGALFPFGGRWGGEVEKFALFADVKTPLCRA